MSTEKLTEPLKRNKTNHVWFVDDKTVTTRSRTPKKNYRCMTTAMKSILSRRIEDAYDRKRKLYVPVANSYNGISSNPHARRWILSDRDRVDTHKLYKSDHTSESKPKKHKSMNGNIIRLIWNQIIGATLRGSHRGQSTSRIEVRMRTRKWVRWGAPPG